MSPKENPEEEQHEPKLFYHVPGQVMLFHGDCRLKLPELPPAKNMLLLTDPPYGIKVYTTRKRKVGKADAFDREYSPIMDDDKEFDATHLLGYQPPACRGAIIFGGEYMKLPMSKGWICWDKRDGMESSGKNRGVGLGITFGEFELAWTNCQRSNHVLINHRWLGAHKASEQGENRIHPTQKPVEMLMAIIDTFSEPDDIILDPYAGSGSTLLAAARLGRRAIGIEYELEYCREIKYRFEREPGFEPED